MTGNHSSVSFASDQVHGNRQRLDKKTRIAIYFALAVLVLAYLPSLVFHVADLWARSHYRFVPFLIPGVAILAIPRLRKDGSLRPRVYSTIAFVSFCWCLLLLAVIMASPWLGM